MLLTLLSILLPNHLPLPFLLPLPLNQALVALQGEILKKSKLDSFVPALERFLHLGSSQYNLLLLQPPIPFFLVILSLLPSLNLTIQDRIVRPRTRG